MAVYIFENNFFAEGCDIIQATSRVCMSSIGTQHKKVQGDQWLFMEMFLLQ